MNGAAPPSGSRLGRVIPTLEDLRERLLLEHPECRRVQAGGAPRMLPIAQVLCDWASPAGQRVIAEYLEAAKTPAGLERYVAKRERIAERFGRMRGELEAREWCARRAQLVDQAGALATQWAAEDAAAAAAASAKRSAA